MQGTQRVLFSWEFGTLLTFTGFQRGPQQITEGKKRRATSAWSAPSPVRYVTKRGAGRVHKRYYTHRGASLKDRVRAVRRLSRRVASRATRGLRALHAPYASSAPLKDSSDKTPMSCFGKFLATLFLHVNVMLAAYCGAGLATSARLCWDPTTYVVAREMFPEDFKLATIVLPAASIAVLLLAHLAVLALVMPPCTRFTMLILYVLVMLAMLAGEGWLTYYVAADVDASLRDGKERLQSFISHTRSVLAIMAEWHGFGHKFDLILQEMEKDAPMNIIVAKYAAIIFGVLQVCAVALALMIALTGRPRRAKHPPL